MNWLIRIADRTHALALPGAWFLFSVSWYSLVLKFTPEETCCWDNDAQLLGTALFYSLIPAYLMAAMVYLSRGNQRALIELEAALGAEAISTAEFRAPGWVVSVAVLLGIVFALSQFDDIVDGSELVNPWFDLSMVAGNVAIWMTVGLLSVERGRAALTFRRLGRVATVDLYETDALKPFARVATRTVLMVMGVLALMPLQSLDAEFRLDNYVYGLVVALPLAGIDFYLCLSGVHGAMVAEKMKRLGELQSAISNADKADIVALEALVAHRDRVRGLHAWPLDLSLLSRVAFYLIIPPAAWVGAALVETLVEGFLT